MILPPAWFVPLPTWFARFSSPPWFASSLYIVYIHILHLFHTWFALFSPWYASSLYIVYFHMIHLFHTRFSLPLTMDFAFLPTRFAFFQFGLPSTDTVCSLSREHGLHFFSFL
jgi:hypothetical protein